MFNKRYLFLMIIVCFFAISAVNAEKINSTTNIELSISEQNYIELSDDYGNDIIMDKQNDSFLSLSDDDVLKGNDWQHTSSENYDVKIEYGTVYLKNTHTGVSSPLKMDEKGRYTNDNAHMYDLPQYFIIGGKFYHIHYPGDFCSLDWYYIAEPISSNKYTIVVSGLFNNNNEITGYAGSPSHIRINVYNNGKEVNNGYVEIIDSGFQRGCRISNYEANFDLNLKQSTGYIIKVKYFEEMGGIVSASRDIKVVPMKKSYIIDIEYPKEVTVTTPNIDLTAKIYSDDNKTPYINGLYVFMQFPDSSNYWGWSPHVDGQQVVYDAINHIWYAKFRIPLSKFIYSSGTFSNSIKLYLSSSENELPVATNITRVTMNVRPVEVRLFTKENTIGIKNLYGSAHILIGTMNDEPVNRGYLYVKCLNNSGIYISENCVGSSYRSLTPVFKDGYYVYELASGRIKIEFSSKIRNESFSIFFSPFTFDSEKYLNSSTLIFNVMYYRYLTDFYLKDEFHVNQGVYNVDINIANKYSDEIMQNASVSLKIDNEYYTGVVNNNKVTFSIDYYPSNLYGKIYKNAEITYTDDYISKSKNVTLLINNIPYNRKSIPLNLTSPKQITTYIGEKTTVNISNLFQYNQSYNKLANIEKNILDLGSDFNYCFNNNCTLFTFTPYKHGSSLTRFYISYECDGIIYYGNVIINITVLKLSPKIQELNYVGEKDSILNLKISIKNKNNIDVTGSIYLEFNNQTYNTVLKNNIAIFKIQLPNQVDLYGGKIRYLPNPDSAYLEDEFFISINVTNPAPNINVIVNNIHINESANINIDMNNDINTTLTISVDGYYKVNITNGKGKLIISNLSAGHYPVEIFFNGDSNYCSANKYTSFFVSRYSPRIMIKSENITVGQIANIEVDIKDATGIVRFFIGYRNIVSTIKNGKAKAEFSGLSMGNYTVYITYGGDDFYYDISKQVNLCVNGIDPNLNISNNLNEDLTVNVHYGATGNIIIVTDYKNYTSIIKNGKAVFKNIDFPSGNHIIKVIYSGDNKFYPKELLEMISIQNEQILVEDLVKDYGDNKKFIVTLLNKDGYPMKNKDIKISIDSNNYIKTTDLNGIVSMDINLDAGNYEATVQYNGVSTTSKIIINKLTTNISLIYCKIYDDAVNLIASVNPSTASGNVVFTVDGHSYSAKIIDSKATYALTNLRGDQYSVEAKYNGDVNHKSSTSNSIKFDIWGNNNNILVPNKNDISAPNLNKYYKGPERFVVTVKEDNKPVVGKNITINLNNVPYIKTTDANGQASMAINLNSGVYNVITEYKGTKVYSTITVKDTVIAKDINKIYRNGTQYQGTFVDSKGNLVKNTDIRININGVYYTRTTDANGMAQMNINLPQGTYILTAINPLSGEQHTTIVTVLPNIVENYDVTKYYKNASQYSLRLLDDKGNPVGAGVSIQLNINGIFYTRTSDANGYVKMNINLPPGTYIITAEYKGLRVSNTIKVLTVLEANDLVMRYHDGSQFKAKVLDGQGKPYAGQTVTYNINGVFYTKISGDDGIAGLTINLPAGEYIITSMYNGLNAANKVTIIG